MKTFESQKATQESRIALQEFLRCFVDKLSDFLNPSAMILEGSVPSGTRIQEREQRVHAGRAFDADRECLGEQRRIRASRKVLTF